MIKVTHKETKSNIKENMYEYEYGKVLKVEDMYDNSIRYLLVCFDYLVDIENPIQTWYNGKDANIIRFTVLKVYNDITIKLGEAE